MTRLDKVVAVGVLAAIASAAVAYARNVTFAEVCEGREPPRFVQKGSDLLIYCQGELSPWMTYKDCPRASVRKRSLGSYAVTCNS